MKASENPFKDMPGPAIEVGAPRVLHPAVMRFCREIVRDRDVVRRGNVGYVQVLPASGARVRHCFDNVASQVSAAGGVAQHGWAIWEWTGVMLEAEFHAVWRDGDGRLVDVTPRDDGQERILFLSDPRLKFEGGRIPNRTAPLYRDALVHDFADLSEARRRLLDGRVRSAAAEREPDLHEDITRSALVVRGMIAEGLLEEDGCACGSGRKYRNCHHRNVRRLVAELG